MHTTEYQAYYNRCRNADWYYDYSDDGWMYERGRQQIAKLQSEASEDETKHAIFHGIKAWVFDPKRVSDEMP